MNASLWCYFPLLPHVSCDLWVKTQARRSGQRRHLCRYLVGGAASASLTPVGQRVRSNCLGLLGGQGWWMPECGGYAPRRRPRIAMQRQLYGVGARLCIAWVASWCCAGSKFIDLFDAILGAGLTATSEQRPWMFGATVVVSRESGGRRSRGSGTGGVCLVRLLSSVVWSTMLSCLYGFWPGFPHKLGRFVWFLNWFPV